MSPNLGNLRRLEIRPNIFSGGVLADYFRVMSPNLGNLLRRFERNAGRVDEARPRNGWSTSTAAATNGDQRTPPPADESAAAKGAPAPANAPRERRIGGDGGTAATPTSGENHRNRRRTSAQRTDDGSGRPTGETANTPTPPTHTLRMAWRRPGRDCNHLVEKLAPPPPQEMGFGAPMSPGRSPW